MCQEGARQRNEVVFALSHSTNRWALYVYY